MQATWLKQHKSSKTPSQDKLHLAPTVTKDGRLNKILKKC